jgi:hypothetical protein
MQTSDCPGVRRGRSQGRAILKTFLGRRETATVATKETTRAAIERVRKANQMTTKYATKEVTKAQPFERHARGGDGTLPPAGSPRSLGGGRRTARRASKSLTPTGCSKWTDSACRVDGPEDAPEQPVSMSAMGANELGTGFVRAARLVRVVLSGGGWSAEIARVRSGSGSGAGEDAPVDDPGDSLEMNGETNVTMAIPRYAMSPRSPKTAFRVRRRESRCQVSSLAAVAPVDDRVPPLEVGRRDVLARDVCLSRVEALTLPPPRRRSARRRPLGARLVARLRDRGDHDAGYGGVAEGGPAPGVER